MEVAGCFETLERIYTAVYSKRPYPCDILEGSQSLYVRAVGLHVDCSWSIGSETLSELVGAGGTETGIENCPPPPSYLTLRATAMLPSRTTIPRWHRYRTASQEQCVLLGNHMKRNRMPWRWRQYDPSKRRSCRPGFVHRPVSVGIVRTVAVGQEFVHVHRCQSSAGSLSTWQRR